jgi:hypothetical protein
VVSWPLPREEDVVATAEEKLDADRKWRGNVSPDDLESLLGMVDRYEDALRSALDRHMCDCPVCVRQRITRLLGEEYRRHRRAWTALGAV